METVMQSQLRAHPAPRCYSALAGRPSWSLSFKQPTLYRRWRRAASAGLSNTPVVDRDSPVRPNKAQHFLPAFDTALQRGNVQECLSLLLQEKQAWKPSSTNGHRSSSKSRSSSSFDGSRTVGTFLDARRHDAFLEACFLAHKPQLALQYVEQLLPPHARYYNALLRCCAKHRDLSLLPAIQAASAAAGFAPDSYSQTALLSALSSSRRYGEAMQVFHSSWQLPSCRTLAVCNAAIGACAAKGDWEAALQVLQLLRQEGIPPDIVTTNSLIKAAGAAGLMDEVLRLYEGLCADGLQPTAVTFTTLFSAAARNQHPDMAWLLQVYEDMARYRVRPNDYTMSSFFTAASYCSCSPGDLEAVFAVLALYRARAKPNDTVVTALLMLCTRAGIADRAVDVWNAVREDGVPYSAHLFSALFKACTVGSSPALVDVAMQAYRDMHMWWNAHKHNPGSAKFESDMLVAYNALLHFVGEMAQLEEALAVFKSMQHAGPTPDVVSYNTMIAACSHLGDTTTALGVLSAMGDAGVAPTERTLGALLNTYAKAGNVNSAYMIFDAIQGAEGIRPNVQIYTSLMDACVKEGSPASLDLALQLLNRMRTEGLQPTAVTYGVLLVACERRRDVDRAFQLYQCACDEGVLPTDECHNVLINVCTEANRLDEALELVKRLARQHGTMQQHTMNSLTRALCPKYIDRALRMLSLTQTLGLKASRRTYLALILGCAKASKSDAAYQLYKSLRAQGMEVDGRSGSELITSLCHANQLELAVGVYEGMLACAWRKELQHKDIPMEVAYKGSLSKRAQVPDGSALAALTQAYAARCQMRLAGKYYKQLRRDAKGLSQLCVTNRRMFELLIENHCRTKNTKLALQVFDDYKAASESWFKHAARSQDSQGRFPKLSNVTLAFLEACCRSEPLYEWRVFDVCAIMRQQKERKVEAKLARPPKRSHHFFESSDWP